MTIDQGVHTQRYQGIVQLDGISLEEVARTYFRQSEQIPTEVRLAVARQVLPGADGSRENWRAGGILAQFLPEAPERLRMPDLPGGDGDDGDVDDSMVDDAWVEVTSLLSTVAPDELFDPTIGTERLLYRLFHEHGVVVFEGVPVADDCSCSREKIHAVLSGFTAEEIVDSIEDGRNPRHLRVLLDRVHVRSGRVRREAVGSQLTVRAAFGRSSEKAGMSTSNVSPERDRMV
jgi:molecular chaperone Hsp33